MVFGGAAPEAPSPLSVCRLPQVLGKRLSRILRAYYLGPHHPSKLRIWWGFRRLTNYPRLTIPYGEGGWITVDERDVVSGFVFVTGDYEPEVWEALSAQARDADVLWDVGANIGTVSIPALLDERIRELHAFEPDPTNASVLERNLALNGTGYSLHRLALGDRSEVRQLHLAPTANAGLSSLAAATSTGVSVAVECRTVDQLVFEDGLAAPTLMKVDVEGWELQVFRGARRLLRELPPRAIVFEAESDPRGQMTEDPLLAELEEAGYRVRRIARQEGGIESRENYLALHPGGEPA
jgi:FkbM family methyltransferase